MYDRDYVIHQRVEMGVDEADRAVREALSAEGFGVLTEIDIQATMKKKLDVDRRPYRILGACNPQLANRALDAELPVGVLLPCNVAVFEGDDGKTYVQAIHPRAMFSVIDSEAMVPLADEVAERLERALRSLA